METRSDSNGLQDLVIEELEETSAGDTISSASTLSTPATFACAACFWG